MKINLLHWRDFKSELCHFLFSVTVQVFMIPVVN